LHLWVTTQRPIADPYLGDPGCAWGRIWARPGLDWITRHCITIALLVSLVLWVKLEMHVKTVEGIGPDQDGRSAPAHGDLVRRTGGHHRLRGRPASARLGAAPRVVCGGRLGPDDKMEEQVD
jgi:hypothetical protein